MSLTTVNAKRGHELEREQKEVHERVGGRKRREKLCDYITLANKTSKR